MGEPEPVQSRLAHSLQCRPRRGAEGVGEDAHGYLIVTLRWTDLAPLT